MNPYIRLLALTIGTLAVLAGAGLAMKSCGRAQVYQEIDHPLLKVEFPIVAIRGGMAEAPENTFTAFDHAAKLKCWIHFDVRMTKDDRLIVIHDPILNRTTDGSGYIREFTLDEIKKFHAGKEFAERLKKSGSTMKLKSEPIPTIEEMLERYKDNVLVIEIQDSYPYAGEQLVDLITKKNMQDQVIFVSQAPGMLSNLRRARPGWLTASTNDELERLVMLSSLGLEGAAPVNGDFIMAPETSGNVELLSETIVNELHRRFKKVILWNINDPAQLERARASRHIDGVATVAPQLLRGTIK